MNQNGGQSAASVNTTVHGAGVREMLSRDPSKQPSGHFHHPVPMPTLPAIHDAGHSSANVGGGMATIRTPIPGRTFSTGPPVSAGTGATVQQWPTLNARPQHQEPGLQQNNRIFGTQLQNRATISHNEPVQSMPVEGIPAPPTRVMRPMSPQRDIRTIIRSPTHAGNEVHPNTGPAIAIRPFDRVAGNQQHYHNRYESGHQRNKKRQINQVQRIPEFCNYCKLVLPLLESICTRATGHDLPALIRSDAILEERLNGPNRETEAAQTYKLINEIFKHKRVRKSRKKEERVISVEAELKETQAMLAKLQKRFNDLQGIEPRGNGELNQQTDEYQVQNHTGTHADQHPEESADETEEEQMPER